MMMLAKLKTAAVAVLALAMVAGGWGIQHAIADEPQPQPTAVPATPVATRTATPNPDDEFLRRTLLDLTGATPTRLEIQLFRSDADAKKRAKVIDWLIADDRVKANLAKRLGIDVERVVVTRTIKDTIAIALANEEESKAVHRFKITSATLSREGTFLSELLPEGTVTNVRMRPRTAAFLLDSGDVNRVNVNTIWTQFFNAGQPQLLNETPVQELLDAEIVYWYAVDVDSVRKGDIEFLKQAVKAARGTDATPLEERYFTEDQNPKKRERLLDELLKDPATAKKLGEAWKKKMLEPAPAVGTWTTKLRVTPIQAEGAYRIYWNVRLPDPNEALVDSLIAAKKTDEQILEAVTLAAANRLPTAEEKKATLAVIGSQADKKAAWVAIAKALTPAK